MTNGNCKQGPVDPLHPGSFSHECSKVSRGRAIPVSNWRRRRLAPRNNVLCASPMHRYKQTFFGTIGTWNSKATFCSPPPPNDVPLKPPNPVWDSLLNSRSQPGGIRCKRALDCCSSAISQVVASLRNTAACARLPLPSRLHSSPPCRCHPPAGPPNRSPDRSCS